MPPTSMRAVVCSGPGRLGLEELPVPEPGPGQVRLRVRACGICGSDIHLLPGGYLGQPVVPGLEMMGVVDALGDGVSGLSPGDLAAVEPLLACGRCDPCLSGRGALCRELQILGIHTNGGFAEYAVAPAERLFRLPADLPHALGALAEPMAVVVHGLQRGGVVPGSRVLVLGAGTLGLLAVLAARDLGAEAWITARYPHQAERAQALGATRVLTEAEGSAEALAALGQETAFGCVLESVGGAADTLSLATAAVAPGGTISVVGNFHQPITLTPFPLFLKEITLAWSNCYEHAHDGADFSRAASLIDGHRNLLQDTVTTHTVGLEAVADGFDLASDRRSGAVKVTVTN